MFYQQGQNSRKKNIHKFMISMDEFYKLVTAIEVEIGQEDGKEKDAIGVSSGYFRG